jgi:diguanylate cyclase (GGDEF)-like protein
MRRGRRSRQATVLRSTVSLIGMAVVVITTLVPPMGFLAVGYYYEDRFSKTLAEVSAAQIASRFASDPAYSWGAMAFRRSGHKARDAHGGEGTERVRDDRGRVVWSAGVSPPAPWMTNQHPIWARGKLLGHAEIITSLRPLLLSTGLIALLSACLGYMAHLAVRAFPLRVLDDTLTALEERNWQLDGALTNVPIGISMFDAESRLVVCNERYREIFQFAPDRQLIGLTADELNQIRIESGIYATEFEKVMKDRLGSGLHSGGMQMQHLSNGRIIATTTQRASGGRVINVHQDITLLEELHGVLAKQRDDLEAKNSQLNIALANMEQGLSMFDRDQRLIIANKRYAEIYGFPPDMLVPGTHIRTFVEHRVDSGDFSSDGAEAYLARRLSDVQSGKSSAWCHDLRDGRRICIRYVPLPQGGWVSTHDDVTEATRREAKIVYMAQHDALTGLYNRYTLADRLKDELSRCHRGHRFALLAIDLDYFKAVNDRHGHAVGDKLLSEVGTRLKTITRDVDAVARLGGDEFAVLQSDIRTAEDALVLAQRIIAGLSEPFRFEGHEITIGASIGIALAPDVADHSDRLMHNGDLALYRAKELGRNASCFFEPALEMRVKDRLALQQDLGSALRNGELELHYQPIVSLETDSITGVEALIRWRHPVRGMIPPSDFIPLAEETGLIMPIGAWALEEACTTIAAWPGNLKVAVNLSAAQFKREDLLKSIDAALRASKIAPERLELEITESLLLETNEAVRCALDQIHDLGVSIALDDFGTGYSSLSYLQSFPFDKIKIDRSFIKNFGTDKRSIDIVRSIVGMAKALDMVVVAEGVETAEQRAIVHECGCEEFQGYFFSKPRPARDIEAMLKDGVPAAGAAA